MVFPIVFLTVANVLRSSASARGMVECVSASVHYGCIMQARKLIENAQPCGKDAGLNRGHHKIVHDSGIYLGDLRRKSCLDGQRDNKFPYHPIKTLIHVG